jgi:hypothetical protein
MKAWGIARLIASNRRPKGAWAVKKLLASILGIAMIVGAKVVIVQAGDHGPKLILDQEVTQVTLSNAVFGPPGPNCKPSIGLLSGCIYTISDFTGTGNSVAFGPFTIKSKTTLLFGANGAFVTPSGGHDRTGNPIGFCAPAFGSGTNTYEGGTISSNSQAVSCCASNNLKDCPTLTDPFGPPTISRISSVITGGTGKYAGISGGAMGNSSSATSSAPILSVFQGVVQLPSGSD